MKRTNMGVFAFACSILFVLPCMAQSSPFNGSWKIDPGTMKYDGPTFTVTTSADGYVVTRQGKAMPKTV